MGPALEKMLWYFKQQEDCDKEKLRRGYKGLSEQSDDLVLKLFLNCSWTTALKNLGRLLPINELTEAMKELKEGKPNEIVKLWKTWEQKGLKDQEFKRAWTNKKENGVKAYLEVIWKEILDQKDCPMKFNEEVNVQKLTFKAYSGEQSAKA